MLITNDNSARWGWSILYSFVGELKVVGDNYGRWESLLFSFSIYAQNDKILYLDIYELLMVNYVALTGRRYVFKLKYNIKTWLKIFKNQYHEKQMHIQYGVLVSLDRC